MATFVTELLSTFAFMFVILSTSGNPLLVAAALVVFVYFFSVSLNPSATLAAALSKGVFSSGVYLEFLAQIIAAVAAGLLFKYYGKSLKFTLKF